MRGEYDAADQGTPRVSRDVPANPSAALPDGLPNGTGSASRSWLVSDDKNPLTPRVTVNRFWAHALRNRGLVKTIEDFGSQGEWPVPTPTSSTGFRSTFVESGWDVKRLLKAIVT